MATLTIRGLDADTHARLRVRAAEHEVPRYVDFDE